MKLKTVTQIVTQGGRYREVKMSVTKNTLNPVIRALIWLERIPGQFPSSRGDKMHLLLREGVG